MGIKGVFNAEGDAWRTQRRIGGGACSAPRTRAYLHPDGRDKAQGALDMVAAEDETLDVVEERASNRRLAPGVGELGASELSAVVFRDSGRRWPARAGGA